MIRRFQIGVAPRAADVVALGLAAMLAGCAGSIPQRTARQQPVMRADQGGSWEMVFASPEVDRARASDWEHSRNNAVLAARSNEPQLATAQWPERDRPRLEYARRLYLPTTASTIIYYPTERSPGHGSSQPAQWWIGY